MIKCEINPIIRSLYEGYTKGIRMIEAISYKVVIE